MYFTIATRKSILAQRQTEIIMNKLKNLGVDSEKLLVLTEGDKRLDVTLDKIGGKGVFIKEIELALINKKAHCAVHSMKDVPYDLIDGFEIIAIPEREDVRDVFISREGLKIDELKKGATIGTGSIRRAFQLKQIREDLNIVPIRGNIQTRIEKMKNENLDGIVLAAAGLKRVNEESLITEYLKPDIFVPAIAQGALGIEILSSSDNKDIFKKLDDDDARTTVEAERSFMRRLNGGCHTLIGAYSKIEGKDLYIIGIYKIGDRIIKKDILGPKEKSIELGITLAEKIINS